MTEFLRQMDPAIKNSISAGAKLVLKNNILGTFTKPAPNLYPHQWNWDAGFIALGYAHFDFKQALEELVSLFKGQWSNGMLPQIVFSPESSGKYFPGYVFWNTKGVPEKPRNVRTSGITMPPVHAFILNRLLKIAPDLQANRQFFNKMYDHILLQHQYFYKYRDPDREGLVFICHPWESGMDNLPNWEDVFTRIPFDEADIPAYKRMDLNHVAPLYRPRDQSYDRFIYLVNLLRLNRFKEPDLWQEYPFLVQEPMFNAILSYSNEALIELGEWLGRDTGQQREWHIQTNRALNDRLWDEERGYYICHDKVHGRNINNATASGLMPLLCGAPDQARAKRLLSTLESVSFSGTTKKPAWLCASTALDDPGFDPHRYWRGPVWINMNWMLYHALLRYGFEEMASKLRSDSLELIHKFGFWEYYNPWKILPDGEKQGGYGANEFSWTAALALDWL